MSKADLKPTTIMTILLDRMPFLEGPGEILVRGERVRIRETQIIVWVSLSLKEMRHPHPAGVPFPAILDTGHTHTFAIQQRHLVEWAGLRPEALRVVSAVRDRGQRLLLREANIWVHVNKSRERVRLIDRPPHVVTAPFGIAIYPEGSFPRLPILGLRAIADNMLVLKVDGNRREATLRTPIKWWWPFA